MRFMCVNPYGETGTFYDRDYCGGETVASVYPAMDLASIAACIRARGHAVDIFDANALRLKRPHILRRVLEFKPDIICLSTTAPSFREDVDLVCEAKKIYPCRFIFIGNYPTSSPQDVLSRAPWIDFLVRGEPEQTIVSLVDTLSSGQEWRCIPGLAYPRNGAEPFIGEKSKPIDDLDSLPMSAHEMLPIAHYFSPYAKRFPMTCLITSRGCRYKCLFCTAPTLSQGRWRGRSPSKVVEEIRYVLTLGAREMFVRDETFTINRARAMEICDRITHTRLRPSWYCFSRVDTVDKATLKIMREAGCHLIIYGIESGNQRVLDLNKKGITLEQSRAAVRLTKECGMRVGTSMMIGMYGDTRESIRDTIRFIRELDPEYGGFTIATPFPGSEFLSVARREGLIGDVRPDRCLYLGDSVLSLPDLGPHEIKKLLTTAYLSYYLRPRQIFRWLSLLRSPKKLYFFARAACYLLRKLLFVR